MKGKILKIEMVKQIHGYTNVAKKTILVVVEVDPSDWQKEKLGVDEECAIHAPRGASTDKRHDK